MIRIGGSVVMKKLGLLGAVAICAMHMPAGAQIFISPLGISGAVSGTRYTTLCTSSSPPECLVNNSGALLVEPISFSFNHVLFSQSLIEGDNFFSQLVASRTEYSGIINNSGGILTGRDLNYFRDSGAGCMSVGCFSEIGHANTFFVTGGIPEPTTWAMMLMGFAAIGVSMRRRRKAASTAQLV